MVSDPEHWAQAWLRQGLVTFDLSQRAQIHAKLVTEDKHLAHVDKPCEALHRILPYLGKGGFA